MYACMYVCMYARMYVCTYVRTYVCMYVCVYVCVCVHLCVYLCAFVCVRVCTCVCVYVGVRVSLVRICRQGRSDMTGVLFLCHTCVRGEFAVDIVKCSAPSNTLPGLWNPNSTFDKTKSFPRICIFCANACEVGLSIHVCRSVDVWQCADFFGYLSSSHACWLIFCASMHDVHTCSTWDLFVVGEIGVLWCDLFHNISFAIS